MELHTRVVQNEILIEVQIARDPRPFAGYIAARKRIDWDKGGMKWDIQPATVWINVGFASDLSLDEIEDIKRWLSEAAKMARLLDDHVTSRAHFTQMVYAARQVTGTLILDKKVREDSGS